MPTGSPATSTAEPGPGTGRVDDGDRERRLEERYAEAEEKLARLKARRISRGPVVLIATCQVLALAVGIVAAIDLNRLHTPRGAALAWTGAAIFGDCTAYRELSLPGSGSPGAGAGEDGRSLEQRCRDLRARTEENRDRSPEVSIDVVEVREQAEQAEQAEVVVRVVTPDRPARELSLELRPKGDGWAVLLTDEVCRALGCP